MTRLNMKLWRPESLDFMRSVYGIHEVDQEAAKLEGEIRRGETVVKVSPESLLMSRLKTRSKAARAERKVPRTEHEERRYARFMAGIYRWLALEQPTPDLVAERLSWARANGFHWLSPYLVEELVKLRGRWPERPPDQGSGSDTEGTPDPRHGRSHESFEASAVGAA